MRVTEITVGAGRTFSHPFESFSNLRPSVTFKAELQDGDDPATVAQALQAKAESLVEDHKQFMLTSLRNLHYLSEAQRRYTTLQEQIKQAQADLEHLRSENPQLELPAAGEGDSHPVPF